MRKHLSILLLLLAVRSAFAASDLALQLLADGEYAASGVEFRRLALSTDVPAESATWYWMAARAYAACGYLDSVESCLSLAKEQDGDSLAAASACLRGELAYADGDYDIAEEQFRAFGEASASNPLALDFALRFRTAAALRNGDAARAREVAQSLPEGESRDDVLAALDAYAAAPRKKPWLGGVLGLIPGLGHVYSGEYANGFRSLFLNGLFLWGMVEAADEDLWGVFAVAGFAELTWYSGSVYGGIDAAHRYNRARLDEAAASIEGTRRPAPDAAALPLLQLRFDF